MSYDPDYDPLTYVWTQISGPTVTLVYSPGDTNGVMPSFMTPWVSADTQVKFRLTVSDPYAGSSAAYVCVTIINSHTPPDASHAHADVGVLWPPDHKMALIRILGIVNPSNDPVTIDSVRQDEPTNGLGDGDTPIDAIISGDSVQLRAERSGNGNGRVYHICFTVHDPEQDATGCVTVSVPKSKKTDVAVDGGSLYRFGALKTQPPERAPGGEIIPALCTVGNYEFTRMDVVAGNACHAEAWRRWAACDNSGRSQPAPATASKLLPLQKMV